MSIRWIRIRKQGARSCRGVVTAWLIMAAALIAAGGIIGELAFLPEANPPGRHRNAILSDRSEMILRRACFDCHSNETRWPWYSYVPPLSALIAWDVATGRSHVNFSDWDTISAHEQAEDLQQALEMIREGEMPLPRYLWLHPDARVSEAELATLTEDIRERHGAKYIEKPTPGTGHQH